jgi:hypothetical protein
MFVKSYTALLIEFEALREILLGCARSWLGAVAQEAERHGERLLEEVGLQPRGAGRQPARLELGEAVSTERTTSLSLRILVEETGLLPSLEGSLDAAWLGDGRSHLALSVRYEPAAGGLGPVVVRALLHRVVEAVALRFVELAAERLQEACRPA